MTISLRVMLQNIIMVHFESIKARPADSFVISNKCWVLKIEGKTKEFLSFKEYCLKDERENFINLYEFPNEGPSSKNLRL